MTSEQALRQAQRLHLAGEAAAAEAAYRALLDDDAVGVAACHWLGFLLLQQERLADAYALLSRAVANDGSHAEWHFNLGLASARLHRGGEAIAAMRTAIALDPSRYCYWTHLGALLTQAEQEGEAESALRQAVSLDPQCPDAYYLLRDALLPQQRYAEARRSNAQGVLAEPPGKMTPIAVAQACCELGRWDQARAMAESWLAQQPDHPVALHMLAAFGQGDAPASCSNAYVGQAFNAAAAGFDQALARLRYRGPQWVADCLARLAIAPASRTVLDLGCGTGLIGAVLRPYARRLDGVDLSEGMLEHARAKQLFDNLHQADMLDHLRLGPRGYDLISCLDTLPYLGALDRLFDLCAASLNPGGLLLFCTEMLEDDQSDYRLHHSGRYRHHPGYLDRLLAGHWRVLARERLPVRDEAGCPVMGEFVCALRDAAEG
ncbi:methyltransferase domain-containing protein [Chromobacterium amazonense]|uniref:methyltransferase domain-containing protein n=1 Tax=Chromobacterium amazonense TaxID=1382803 RepID=UPI0031F6ED0A